jgi:hypothetical protein
VVCPGTAIVNCSDGGGCFRFRGWFGGSDDSLCCFVPGDGGNCDAVATVAGVFAQSGGGGKSVGCFVLKSAGCFVPKCVGCFVPGDGGNCDVVGGFCLGRRWM